MNLITGQFRTNLEDARDSVFDTFCRTITCYKTPIKTILSTDDNFSYSYSSPDYDNTNSSDLVQYTPVSGKFQACVQYDKNLERLFSTPTRDNKEGVTLSKDDGLVRIKVKSGDYQTFIKDGIDFQFDGYLFKQFRTERPHGVFSPKYYTLYLKFQN